MARREPVRRRRELDSYMQTLTGGNSADRVQVIVEPKIDDRPRNETGSPVRGGVAHSTGKRRGQRVGRHVDTEPSMTNDTKIVIELQAVETERALVVRGLVQEEVPQRARNDRYLPNIVPCGRSSGQVSSSGSACGATDKLSPQPCYLRTRNRIPNRPATASRCQARYHLSWRGHRNANFTSGVPGPLPTPAGCHLA